MCQAIGEYNKCQDNINYFYFALFFLQIEAGTKFLHKPLTAADKLSFLEDHYRKSVFAK